MKFSFNKRGSRKFLAQESAKVVLVSWPLFAKFRH
jgi:hypothetical protein